MSDAHALSTPSLPQVISCKKAALVARGYKDFEDWASRPGHVYIGRDMSRFVKGATGSKWCNPFKATTGMTLEERIQGFEAHLRASSELMDALPELLGAKELGCWCTPAPCHGDSLIRCLALLNGGAVPRSVATGMTSPKAEEVRNTLGSESASVAQPHSVGAPQPHKMKPKRRLQ